MSIHHPYLPPLVYRPVLRLGKEASEGPVTCPRPLRQLVEEPGLEPVFCTLPSWDMASMTWFPGYPSGGSDCAGQNSDKAPGDTRRGLCQEQCSLRNNEIFECCGCRKRWCNWLLLEPRKGSWEQAMSEIEMFGIQAAGTGPHFWEQASCPWEGIQH